MKPRFKPLLLTLLTLTLTSCSLDIVSFTPSSDKEDNSTDSDTSTDDDKGTDTSDKDDGNKNTDPSEPEDKKEDKETPSVDPDEDKKVDPLPEKEKLEIKDFEETLPTSTPLKKATHSGYYKTQNMAEYRMEKYRFLSDLNSPLYSDSSYRMPTTGSSKLLVIPVYFTDVSAPTTEELSNIEKAFFGKASDTGWESLNSYYKTASYGTYSFSGEVAKPYAYPASTAEVNTTDEYSAYSFVESLIKDAVDYERTQGMDMTKFDSNQDGYIDGVEIIYFYNTRYSQNKTLWWQYTSSVLSTDASADDPQVRRFFFTGYKHMANDYYTPNIDTHAIVHETGHLLGLTDYYNYDYTGNYAGLNTMMDHNIGDLDAYSKMLLGWVDPYVIDGSSDEFTLSLNSFADTGDCVILRNTTTDPYNGTPYDEYLILQYYTPTGNNQKDAQGYKEWYNKGMYTIPGLQVYHVDSRTMTATVTANNFQGTYDYSDASYTDTPLVSRKTIISNRAFHKFQYSFIPASNTPSYASTDLVDSSSQYHLITAIPADKNIDYDNQDISNMGNNKVLFTAKGKGGGANSFTMSTYASFFEKSDSSGNATFNDGTKLDYTFSVTSNDSSGCTLKFSKLS